MTTVDENQLFGELRSLLHQPPGETCWSVLCGLLDAFSPHWLRERALPYTRSHLGAWPDALRVAPARWLTALSRGEEVPAMELVRVIEHRREITAPLLDALAGDALPHGLHSLRLWNRMTTAQVERLASAPVLSGLEELDLRRARMGDDGALALLRSPHLGDLTRLRLDNNNLGPAGLEAIARFEGFTKLRALRVEHNAPGQAGARAFTRLKCATQLDTLGFGGDFTRTGMTPGGIGPEGVQVLADADLFANIRRLLLPNNFIAERGAVTLARATMTRIEHLDLSSNYIGMSGLRRLLQAEFLPRVRSLDLSRNALGTEGARVLGRREALSNLEELRLFDNDINGRALSFMLGASSLGALRKLHLNYNTLDDSALRAFSGSLVRNLRELDLGRNRLRDEAMHDLASATCLSKLESLTLYGNEIGGRGVGYLTRAETLEGMRELDLSDNPIGDAGARYLATGRMEDLRSLRLWRCGIGDEGARHLAESPVLANLVELDLFDNPITEAGRAALAASPHMPEHLRHVFQGSVTLPTR